MSFALESFYTRRRSSQVCVTTQTKRANHTKIQLGQKSSKGGARNHQKRCKFTHGTPSDLLVFNNLFYFILFYFLFFNFFILFLLQTHLQHLWFPLRRDATLRELTDLIKEVNPAARNRNGRISFALVYPDKRGNYVSKNIGITHPYKRGEDDRKTLDRCRFVTGDYLSVAIYIA